MILLLAMLVQAPAPSSDIRGDWINQRQTAVIRISDCPTGICGVVTWSADRPRSLTSTPAPPAAELARDGEAIVCFADNSGCKSDAAARAKDRPGSRVVESTILRAFFRSLGKPQGYTITLIPPAR